MPKPNRLADLAVQRKWDTYAYIGEFVCCFSSTENALALVLSNLLAAKSIDRFEIVVRGMDARVKCERLRAMVALDGSIGPNLEARLRVFERSIIKQRNKLAHNWLIIDPKAPDDIQMVQTYIGEHKPPSVSTKRHANLSYWLINFNVDLFKALRALLSTGIFETDHPLSSLRPEEPSKGLQEEILAILGKPAQTEDKAPPDK
jgi:hypothetical protein